MTVILADFYIERWHHKSFHAVPQNMHMLCPGAVLPPGTQSVMATEWEPPHRQAHFHTDEACAAAARSSVLWNFNDLLSVFSFFSSLLSTPCLCVRECLCVHVMRLRFGIQRDTNWASTVRTGGEQRQCDFEGICIFTPGEHLLRSSLLGFVRLATQPTFNFWKFSCFFFLSFWLHN